MAKKIFLLIIFTSTIAFSQTIPKEYYFFIKLADSLFKNKEYKQAAIAYNQAFSANERKAFPNDRYNAACAWARANYFDSAFINLNKLATKSHFSDYNYIISDANFNFLHNDIRWTELLNTIKANKNKLDEKYNKTLVTLIDSMRTEDQKWRELYRELFNNEIDSTLYTKQLLHKNAVLTDSLNYYVCKKIMATYGYPNHNLVGIEASHNFWLLIQHQDKHILFQDSVLKKMKIEVDKNQVSGKDYAYLIDRVKVNMKELQIYGTQMILNKNETSYEPQPTIEIEKLNERRKSVGLGTEEDYIKLMNSTYFGTLKN